MNCFNDLSYFTNNRFYECNLVNVNTINKKCSTQRYLDKSVNIFQLKITDGSISRFESSSSFCFCSDFILAERTWTFLGWPFFQSPLRMKPKKNLIFCLNLDTPKQVIRCVDTGNYLNTNKQTNIPLKLLALVLEYRVLYKSHV